MHGWHKFHKSCGNPDCKVYTVYIRVKKKLRRLAKYHTKCHELVIIQKTAISPDGTPTESYPITVDYEQL